MSLCVGMFVLSSLTLANAQVARMGDKTYEEKAQIITDKQKESLALEDEQAAQMYNVNLKYIEEMETILAGGRSFSTMQKLRKMSSRKDKETKEILSKDQYKLYLKDKDQMREQMKARMRAGS